jgi:hypothetical protein
MRIFCTNVTAGVTDFGAQPQDDQPLLHAFSSADCCLTGEAKKITLQRVIRGQVSLDSVIISDGWRGYNRLVDVGFDSIYASKRPSMAKQGMSETAFILTASKISGRSQNAGWQNSMV